MNDHSSWSKGFLLAVLVLVGGAYGHRLYLEHKVSTAQAELSPIIGESVKAEPQTFSEQILRVLGHTTNASSADEKERREREAIRVEAHRGHLQYQEYLHQVAREKDEAENRANIAKLNEEREALIRRESEIAAFKRALSIPVRQN